MIQVVAVPWLSQLPVCRCGHPGFHSDSVHAGFVVNKVALGQVSLRSL
jgi:hypothetical protein